MNKTELKTAILYFLLGFTFVFSYLIGAFSLLESWRGWAFVLAGVLISRLYRWAGRTEHYDDND